VPRHRTRHIECRLPLGSASCGLVADLARTDGAGRCPPFTH
jgi:hypothetical protein